MLQMNAALFGVGVFVEALAAAMLHFELEHSLQSSFFGWLVPNQTHRAGLCVHVALRAWGQLLHNPIPAELLILRLPWAQL